MEDYNYKIEILSDLTNAQKVIKFLIEVFSKDAILTPGEVTQIHRETLLSLHSRDIKFWYIKNEADDVIAAIGIKETEHKTNGYCITFIAVENEYRNFGFGKKLIEIVTDHVKNKRGRFLIVDTSSKPQFAKMRAFIVKNGFEHVGTFPEYYYEGEDTIWYYKKLT